jgi:hypothetical protein
MELQKHFLFMNILLCFSSEGKKKNEPHAEWILQATPSLEYQR